MKLTKELAKAAEKTGACVERQEQLRLLTDKRQMVQMYLNEIDFCVQTDFPSREIIRKHFKGMIEQHNVYLDEFIALLNPGRVVALGETKGHARFDGYSVGRLYVTHNAEVKVKAEDSAFVMIDLFNEGEVTIEASGDAKVCVNCYEGVIRKEESGNAVIKVIHKKKRDYENNIQV